MVRSNGTLFSGFVGGPARETTWGRDDGMVLVTVQAPDRSADFSSSGESTFARVVAWSGVDPYPKMWPVAINSGHM